MWAPEGWAQIREHGIGAPLFWRREGGHVAAAPLRGGRARPGGRAGAPRELVRGRRVRALGGPAAADRGGVGEGRPARPGLRRSLRYPWGDEDPTPAHANLGQRHLRPALSAATRRGVTARRTAADRRRVGVDVERLPALPGLRAVPLPRVLRGVLRQRAQGAARRLVRGGRGGLPWHVPQLGPAGAPADLLRIPHRQGRSDVPSYRLPGAAVDARRGDRRPPHGLVPAVVGAAPPAARHGQRGRIRRRLVRRGRPGARALPAGRAHLGRPRLHRPGPGDPHAARCSPPYGTRPSPGPTGRPRPRRSPTGPGCSATTARSGGWPGSVAPARRGAAAPRSCCAGGAQRLGAGVGAGPAPAGATGTSSVRRWPAPSPTSRRPPPAPGSTCC